MTFLIFSRKITGGRKFYSKSLFTYRVKLNDPKYDCPQSRQLFKMALTSLGLRILG
jgi:hypothetical protein